MAAAVDGNGETRVVFIYPSYPTHRGFTTTATTDTAAVMTASCGADMVNGTMRKSCQYCRWKKVKCSGGSPCRRCVTTGQPQCIFEQRQPDARRRRRWGDLRHSESPRIVNEETKSPRHATSNAGVGLGSLKRCRFTASPATGLIGMEENALLSDYVACMGFLNVTTESLIRESIVNLMSGHMTSQKLNPKSRRCKLEITDGDDVPTSGTSALSDIKGANQVTAASSEEKLKLDASTCVFWCTVALGALVQGRPVPSVEHYVVMAKNALQACFDGGGAHVARAYVALAYVRSYSGDSAGFLRNVLHAHTLLRLEPHPDDTAATDYTLLVRHDGVQDFQSSLMRAMDAQPTAEEPQSIAHKPQGPLDWEDAQWYGTLRHERFRNAALADLFFHPATIDSDGRLRSERGGPSNATCEENGLEDGVILSKDTALSFMRRFLKQFANPYQRLEADVDRQLAVLKWVDGDTAGAAIRDARSVAALTRFPGLCRGPVGAHAAHEAASTFACLKSRDGYDKVREVYNSMRPPGTRALPPMEEWVSVSYFCDHVYCRVKEQLLLALTREAEDLAQIPRSRSDSSGATRTIDESMSRQTRDRYHCTDVGPQRVHAEPVYQTHQILTAVPSPNERYSPPSRHEGYSPVDEYGAAVSDVMVAETTWTHWSELASEANFYSGSKVNPQFQPSRHTACPVVIDRTPARQVSLVDFARGNPDRTRPGFDSRARDIQTRTQSENVPCARDWREIADLFSC